MEMHQLRYVVAVARTGNFSRAAEECRVAQPSLSQQIQKLEDELGERLFDRLRRGAKLTAHGEAFLPRAVRILEEVEAARHEAREANALLRGTLSLGVLPTIAPYLLRDVLVRFAASYPDVQVVIHEDTTAALLRQLHSCEIDLALASRPLDDATLTIRDLFSEELKLALPPGHRLARRRQPITLDDLREEQLIVMKPGHCLGEQVLGFCQRGDTAPRIAFRGAQLETIQSLVHAGIGLSLIPAMAARPDHPAAPVYRSLNHPRPQRTISALWTKNRPPTRAAGEFLRIVEERNGKADGEIK